MNGQYTLSCQVLEKENKSRIRSNWHTMHVLKTKQNNFYISMYYQIKSRVHQKKIHIFTVTRLSFEKNLAGTAKRLSLFLSLFWNAWVLDWGGQVISTLKSFLVILSLFIIYLEILFIVVWSGKKAFFFLQPS